jgi:hypothetical protein
LIIGDGEVYDKQQTGMRGRDVNRCRTARLNILTRQVYRADLGLDQTLSRACQHVGNLWSLHGLHECLTQRGETVEALLIKQQLDQAMARAEVPVYASCYCRQQAAA